MAAYQKYKGYSIETIASQTGIGLWRVEVTVKWKEDGVEKSKKFGPYEGFHGQDEAELWGVQSAIAWIDADAGKPTG